MQKIKAEFFGSICPQSSFPGEAKYPTVWPYLLKNRHFGQILKVFGNIWNLHFALVKLLNLLMQIFIGVSGQILKNNFAIWSH